MKKVETEVTIDADAATVWKAISEGEELRRWFPLDARVTPGAGGAVWQSFGEGMEWESPIELWEPNRRLRTSDSMGTQTLAVDYTIEARGGETVLRIVHSGFADDAWDDEIETLNSGWRTFLEQLKHYLERHRGEERTVAYYRHPVVPLSRAEAFPKMLAALGVPLVGVGEHFTGPLFEGIARVSAPPVNFTATLANHGDGALMIEIEPGKGKCRPSVWVSLYGDAGAEAETLTQRLRELVDAAFA